MRTSAEPPRRRAVALRSSALAALWIAFGASAQVDPATCGPVANAFGPFDYRTQREQLGIVERPHFPPLVEALIGTGRAPVGGDLGYTLRAFPNHHRALIAVMRYGEKLKTPHPRDLAYPVECYFERALRFRPDDTVARMIYAQFLSHNNRVPESLAQLALTEARAGDNAFTHYNLGMLYADLKEYDKSMARAREAYRLGFSRPELRERLSAVGKWVEPDGAQRPADAAASSGSSGRTSSGASGGASGGTAAPAAPPPAGAASAEPSTTEARQ